MGKKLGLIGGKGKMGTLFKELVKACNITIVSTPITQTVLVIEAISEVLTQNNLLIDLTSLKSSLIDVMMHSKDSLIGLHPLFGPSVTELQNQRIVMFPQRPRDWQAWLIEGFEKRVLK